MATLLDIRTKFIEFSGRYDLASPVDVWTTDNGADYFINAGIRYLDLRQEHLETAKVWAASLAQGDFQITVTEARSINEVWIHEPTGDPGWRELEKRDVEYILLTYPDFDQTTEGTPVDWSPAIALNPENSVLTGTAVAGDTVLNIMPPPDQAYTIQIFGDFKSKLLALDADVNYWTVQYEEAAVLAALMRLEGVYRNTQGVNDFRNQIDEILTGIDQDMVLASMPGSENMAMRG